MKKSIIIFVFASVLFSCTSDELDNLVYDESNNYQAILDSFTKKGFPGVGVLIRTTEGTWNGSSGFASLENNIQISAEHLFFSSSCAKAYTATAVLMLYERNLLNLDACIDQYLPNSIADKIPNGHKATVKQLLRHTSGIPDSDEKMPVIEIHNKMEDWYWQDDLEGIYGMPPLFEPGTSLEYKATNYILLAIIVDQITGNHARFFNKEIFQPFELDDTYYKLESGLPHPDNLVETYFDRYGDGRLENFTEILCTYSFNTTYGSCGLIATLADYSKFLEALFNGEIIGDEALSIMKAPSFPGYEWRGMGVGVFNWIDNKGNSHSCYEMAGSSIWGLTQVRYFPDDNISLACATNIASENRPNSQMNFLELLNDLSDMCLTSN